MPVVNFSVATDEAYVDKEGKREERTEWHRAVVVGKLALTCHAYLKKGQQVFVEGPLSTREWESNGRSNRRTEIVAATCSFLEHRRQSGLKPRRTRISQWWRNRKRHRGDGFKPFSRGASLENDQSRDSRRTTLIIRSDYQEWYAVVSDSKSWQAEQLVGLAWQQLL